MPLPISITDLTEYTHSARVEWDKAIEKLDDKQLVQPDVCGPWSVKDIIAHVAWYDNQMVDLISSHSMAGSSEWWLLPTDERNENIYQEIKNKPLNDVRHQAKAVFEALLNCIYGMKDEELTDPSHFDGMPLDWLPIDIIAQNTWLHTQAHLPGILSYFQIT
ncbi:MAG: maleylpyruvate isomerase N-terminal domain-containing protein [Anaerolineaceae bacterium]|nr:maleylpyruvate isomerase N-terminal domain-containing protein [Anaerolineaceae bacterium]